MDLMDIFRSSSEQGCNHALLKEASRKRGRTRYICKGCHKEITGDERDEYVFRCGCIVKKGLQYKVTSNVITEWKK